MKRHPPVWLNCEQCGKEFLRHISNRRNTKHDFCGKVCFSLWSKGKFTQSNQNSLKNLVRGQEDKSIHWKGDKVGYQALHTWLRMKLGKPDTCEFCGEMGLTGNQIHWANKAHQYKRNLNDWLRLCVKCHNQYDKENGLRRKIKNVA